jgi:hypothetical protein
MRLWRPSSPRLTERAPNTNRNQNPKKTNQLSVNDLEECIAAASKDAGVINFFLWVLANKSHVLR